jgi:hypothetical protein
LPLQRSFTVLPSPLIPLGYVNATVSPVRCELSVPLNPNVSGTPCGMYLPRWNITARVVALSALVLALMVTADS